MKFIVSGKNYEVTDALKERVAKKVGKLSKFFNPDTEVHATFSSEKNKHIIEVTIPFNGTVFRAEEKNDEMFTSIDKIVDTLEAQIIKYKTKSEQKVKGIALKDSFRSTESMAEMDEDEFNIVESKNYSVKPMTVEEAIMQMNLEKDELFVFHNFDTKKVNVVYKLDNKKYGIIEPED